MTFEHPEFFLLLLLIPLMAGAAMITSRRRQSRWHRLVAQRLRSILVHQRDPRRRWAALAVFMLAFALLVITLASPTAGYREVSGTIRGRNLLIAIDVSRSMLAEDETPNRYGAAMASALELLDRFPDDRIGIIAFSGSAWLQSPLTIDHGALRDTFQQLNYEGGTQDWIPRDGSDLAAAVRLAIKTFVKTGQRDNALIILSDGETHHGGVEQAAEAAARAGLTIFSAGFGTSEGALIPDPTSPDQRFHDRHGNLAFTRLNSAPLVRLAQSTEGIYMEGAGSEFLSKLAIAIQRLERYELEGRRTRIAIPRFQWFLAPSMLFFTVGMLLNSTLCSRLLPAGATTAVLLLLFGSSLEAPAGIIPPTAAQRAYEQGRHMRALELFAEEIARARGERRRRLHLGEGATAYRLQDYSHASEAFSAALLSNNKAVRAQAHFGLGNTEYYKGLALKDASGETDLIARYWNDAISHFEEVLSLNPDNTRARENRDLVRRQLEELRSPQPPEQTPPSQPNDAENPPPDRPEEKKPGDKPDPDSSPPDQKPPENPQEGDPKPRTSPPEQRTTDAQDEDAPPDNEGNSIKPRPGESPASFARRILNENADFELKPLPRKLRAPRRSGKDW